MGTVERACLEGAGGQAPWPLLEPRERQLEKSEEALGAGGSHL
jgi:hypothetical protein